MDNRDRLQELMEGLKVTYLMLTKLLAQLPVPIDLPPLRNEEDGTPNMVNALEALDRARQTLIPDQPITEDQQSMLGRAVLDWMTARDLGAIVQTFGNSQYRLDGMDYALDRVMLFAEEAAGELGIDLS